MALARICILSQNFSCCDADISNIQTLLPIGILYCGQELCPHLLSIPLTFQAHGLLHMNPLHISIRLGQTLLPKWSNLEGRSPRSILEFHWWIADKALLLHSLSHLLRFLLSGSIWLWIDFLELYLLGLSCTIYAVQILYDLVIATEMVTESLDLQIAISLPF